MLTPEKLRALAPERAGIGVRYGPVGSADDLAAEEMAELGSSVPESRRLEFALGRSAARDALADLGAAVAPIPIGPAGEPVWPDGFVGSISHGGGVAIAVAGWRRDLVGIGVDVEPETRRAGERTAGRICTPAEMEWVSASADPGLQTMLVFCSKEAVYKASSLVGRTDLGFHDVEFAREPGGALLGRIKGAAAPHMPRRFTARTLVADGFIVACVQMPAGDQPAHAPSITA